MKSFHRFTLANLFYTLLVIVWGAFVRATGSGAGCGDHWPLCNGEIIPQATSIKMTIEFLHRASSGISLILVFVGFIWARSIAKSLTSSLLANQLRKTALLSLIAILMEAALGAMLVLLKLVEFDQSVTRTISISLHLVNTLFLLATLTTLCCLSRPESKISQKLFPRNPLFLTTLFVFVLLGITGAIAALGDTLFPSESLVEGMVQELSASAHFLIRLRVLHPVFACVWIIFAFVWAQRLLERNSPRTTKIRLWFLLAVSTQFILGFMNWILMAPNALQLLHLLIADLVFISFWVSGLEYEHHET